MKISVIIPTCNRANILRNNLYSLQKQTLNQDLFEILIIDNNSLDNTFGVYKEFINSFKNIKYFLEKKPGLHEARHRGLREASSEILVYCDDDIEASNGWLENILISFIKDKDIVLLGGKNLPKWEGVPPDWLLERWKVNDRGFQAIATLSILDFGEKAKEVDSNYIWGCNFSVKRNIVETCGGFNPDSMPKNMLRYRGDGETYLALKIQNLGFKSFYNPKAVVYHFVPKSRQTPLYFFERAFRQGISQSFTDYRKGISKFNLIEYRKEYKVETPINIEYSQSLINKYIKKNFENGYLFHRQCLSLDEELKNWVLRKIFFE